MNVARYYVGKLLAIEDPVMRAVWRARVRDTARTPLPDDLPARAKLLASGVYVGLEAVVGATEDELEEFAGLTPREARAVVAATGEREDGA